MKMKTKAAQGSAA